MVPVFSENFVQFPLYNLRTLVHRLLRRFARRRMVRGVLKSANMFIPQPLPHKRHRPEPGMIHHLRKQLHRITILGRLRREFRVNSLIDLAVGGQFRHELALFGIVIGFCGSGFNQVGFRAAIHLMNCHASSICLAPLWNRIRISSRPGHERIFIVLELALMPQTGGRNRSGSHAEIQIGPIPRDILAEPTSRQSSSPLCPSETGQVHWFESPTETPSPCPRRQARHTPSSCIPALPRWASRSSYRCGHPADINSPSFCHAVDVQPRSCHSWE